MKFRIVLTTSGLARIKASSKELNFEQSELKVTAAYFAANGAKLDLYKCHDSLFISFRKMVRNIL